MTGLSCQSRLSRRLVELSNLYHSDLQQIYQNEIKEYLCLYIMILKDSQKTSKQCSFQTDAFPGILWFYTLFLHQCYLEDGMFV